MKDELTLKYEQVKERIKENKKTGEKIRSKNAASRVLGINRHELYSLGLNETRKIGRWTVTNVGKAETA